MNKLLPHKRRIDWGNALLCIGFLAMIAFPWGYFAATDVPLVHLYEESVGYRYFYSLRLAHGSEYPWLPQGQLPNLVFVVVQWGLTLAGYPIDQLFPRIQAFVLWGALPPLVFATAAYYFLCISLRGLLLRVMVGIAFVLTIYNPRVVHWWTAIPEYVAWVLPIAIGSCAMTVRLLTRNRDAPISSRTLVLFGVFCGACAAVKVTFLVFPLAVCGIHAMQDWRPKALLRQASIVGIVSAATLFAILVAAFGFNIAALKKFLGDLVIFVGSQQLTLGQAVIPWRWLRDLMPQTPLDFALLVVGAPAAAALGALSLRSSRSLLGILPASIASIAFYAARPYYVTYVETITFAVFTLVLPAILISRSGPGIQSVSVRRVALSGVIVCCIIGAIYIEDRMPSLVGQAQVAKSLGTSYEAVTRRLSSIPGRTAFFAVDNHYRIRSVDGGLCKGAVEIFNSVWSDDRYIARLFPDRSCYYFVKQPVDSKKFDKAVFLSIDIEEPAAVAARRVADFFPANFSNFDCNISIPYFGGRYHICTKQRREHARE